VPLHAITAYHRHSGGTVALVINLSIRCSQQKRPLTVTAKETGLAPQHVRTFQKRGKSLFLLGTQPQTNCTSCTAIAKTSNIDTKKHVICKILHFEVEELMASVVVTSGTYLARKSERKRPLGRPGLNGRRTLKCITQKQDGTVQTHGLLQM
jgi:hypothetical protein